MIKLAVALAFLGLNFYTYNFLARESELPERQAFAEFPMEVDGGWVCNERGEIDVLTRANLGVTDYLLCNFVRAETRELVSLYVGYHESQVREEGGGSRENSIHPPAHCLPGSGWNIIKNETVPLGIEGIPPGSRVRRLVVVKGDNRQLVYYWYHSRGRVIAEDWRKILYVGWDRATRGRTDGSLVRFTVPIARRGDGEEKAEASFREVAPILLQRLPEYVPN